MSDPSLSTWNRDDLLAQAGSIVRDACDTWRLAGLPAEISIEFSARMSRSLARSYPERKLLRLCEDLTTANEAIFRQVVVHEAAHLAAYELYGPSIRPHGPEWRELVERAGQPANVAVGGVASHGTAGRASTGRRRWRHRCLVCQAVRIGARPMRRWRCQRCLELGLDGELAIEALD